MRVVHIITGLNNGGAEMMLYKLIKNTDRNIFEIEVISMMNEGVMGPKIEEAGVKVHTLEMTRGIPSLKGLLKAINICKDAEIIQTWMYHADLFGYLVSLFTKPEKLIWGIRHSNLDKNIDKKLTLLIARINAFLSSKVDIITANSENAKVVHEAYGYDRRIVVVPNGFELDKFSYRENARNELCNELSIDENSMIISLVARWHKMKGHEYLLKAIAKLKYEKCDIVCVLCGTNVDQSNSELMKLINDYELNEHIFLLGRREDIPRIMSASDIYVSASIAGESFPNVIGEAMACETICVVTDVGDSRFIVGETGIIVEAGNALEIYDGIKKVLAYSRDERNCYEQEARKRIHSNFDIYKISNDYKTLYLE